MHTVHKALFMAALLALVPAGAALAQPASPPAAAGASAPGGPGPGPRGPKSPHVGRNYTPGWSMMTTPERNEFHQQMRSAQTRADCQQAMDAHRKLMEERAKERGSTLRGPRHDACAGLPG